MNSCYLFAQLLINFTDRVFTDILFSLMAAHEPAGGCNNDKHDIEGSFPPGAVGEVLGQDTQ
ncbi:hypothetical protein D3C84_1297150 [compost metagenome]